MRTRNLPILIGLAFSASCMGGPSSEEDSANVGANPLKYRSYDVLFTNPMCGPYDLESEVEAVGGGEPRRQTHENAYCFPQRDSSPSGARPTSPLFRLKSWIDGAGQGDEIFAAYFSFSNKAIKNALCGAAQRGARITFVKDSGQDASMTSAVEECAPDNVTILERGNTNDIGYHHNKFLMVNPNQAGPNDQADADGTTYIKLVFSSGNMSSGTVLHQENWHFMEVARDSYFAQSHVCLERALRDEDGVAYSKRVAFTQYMDECRSSIAAKPETDIGAFFLPDKGDSLDLRRRFTTALEHAGSVQIAAHRFSLAYLQSTLAKRLRDDDSFTTRLVADDDLYWLHPQQGEAQTLGDNMDFESWNVHKLDDAAGYSGRFEPRYIETNSDGHLLHHNKFAIMRDRDDGQPDTVVCGAANFTNNAYWYGSPSTKTNFENVYVIQIPRIVQAMERQFDGFWGISQYEEGESHPPVATRLDEMPVRYTRAVEPHQ